MPRTRSLFAVRGARPARLGLSRAPAPRHAAGVGPRNWRTGLRRGADARPLTLFAVSSFSPPAAIVRFELPRPATGAESVVSIISRLGSVDTTRAATKCNRHTGTTYGWYFFWHAQSTAATQRFPPVKARADAYVTSVHFALPRGRSHARTRGSAASHASRPPASRHVTSCSRHRCDRRGCQVSARPAPDTWREPESARRRGALPSLAPAPARGPPPRS